VSNWDGSLAANVPGQSGQPRSPYYGNLLQDWADNKYFNLAFSKAAVEKAAANRLRLVPSSVNSKRQTPGSKTDRH
jgi:penicillin amidase